MPVIFLLSGLYHEFGLLPAYRHLTPSGFLSPTRTPLTSFSDHIFTPFFAAQAIPFVLELGYKKVTGRKVGGWAGWAWCWVWLFGTGRWVARACRDSGVEAIVAGWVREAWAEGGWQGGVVDGVVQAVQEGTRGAMKAIGW